MKKGYLHILENETFTKTAMLYVACSGGPDSVATMHLLKRKYGEKVRALFIDHRTLESANGFATVVHNFPANYVQYSIAPNIHPSEAGWAYARREIYEWVSEARDAIIATGHHLDDSVEEYLINTTKRGTATTLRYNYPNSYLFRPMLLNKKAQFIEYCNKHKLSYIDSSGSTDLRSKIRQSTIVSDINDVMNTNIETIVRKKIHRDHEQSEVKNLGASI